KCGRFKTTIEGIDADEFPIIPDAPLSALRALPSNALRAAINNTAYAAAAEGTSMLSGVLVEIATDSVTMWGCDGHRLARIVLPLDSGEATSAVIPATSLAELARIVTDDDAVEMGIYDDKV